MTSVEYILRDTSTNFPLASHMSRVATQNAPLACGIPTATRTMSYLSYRILGSIPTGCGVPTATHRISYMSHKSQGSIPTDSVGYLKDPPGCVGYPKEPLQAVWVTQRTPHSNPHVP